MKTEKGSLPFKVTFDSCLFTVNKSQTLSNNTLCDHDFTLQDHIRTLDFSGNPVAEVFAEVLSAVSKFL